MPITLRITCINKEDRDNPYEAITGVGGVRDDNGETEYFTQKGAIKLIEKNEYIFHVFEGGERTEVEVDGKGDKKYLRTKRDKTPLNNLLSLPECPRSIWGWEADTTSLWEGKSD